jgi:hypothetical protein
MPSSSSTTAFLFFDPVDEFIDVVVFPFVDDISTPTIYLWTSSSFKTFPPELENWRIAMCFLGRVVGG